MARHRSGGRPSSIILRYFNWGKERLPAPSYTSTKTSILWMNINTSQLPHSCLRFLPFFLMSSSCRKLSWTSLIPLHDLHTCLILSVVAGTATFFASYSIVMSGQQLYPSSPVTSGQLLFLVNVTFLNTAFHVSNFQTFKFFPNFKPSNSYFNSQKCCLDLLHE